MEWKRPCKALAPHPSTWRPWLPAALLPEPSLSWFGSGSPRLSLTRCNDSRGSCRSAHSSRSPQGPAREAAGPKLAPSSRGTFLGPPSLGAALPQLFQAPGESTVLYSFQRTF